MLKYGIVLIYNVDTLGSMYKKIIDDNDCLSVKDLAVNGRDIMDLGIPAGPGVGKILKQLLDAVLDDPSANDKDKLCKMLHGMR